MAAKNTLSNLTRRLERLEKKVNNFPLVKAIWEDRYGNPLTAEEMEDNHILNTISLIQAIERKKGYLPLLQAEAKRRGI